MARPLNSRKLDAFYFIFFIVHTPIMFTADLVPAYPKALVPDILLSFQNWYISTYKDKFFYDPPAWFPYYTYLQLLILAPISLWAIPALLHDSPRVPLNLFWYGLQTSLTTLACLVEMWSWPHLNSRERWTLGAMYGPFLGIGVLLTVDMYLRLANRLLQHSGASKKTR